MCKSRIGKNLGFATTVQIAIFGITATYVSMESPPALKEQNLNLAHSTILFYFIQFQRHIF